MNQLDLNFAPRARKHDPRTSHAAAESVDRFANGHYALILISLRDHGPMTVAEIAVATGLGEHQCNKRTSELQRSGLISLTGGTRPGPSGRQQRVWMAV